jgi:hypothetical protein
VTCVFCKDSFVFIHLTLRSWRLCEKKTINSRQGAKYAKMFRLRTNQTLKFSAVSAPLREKKINARQGAKHAKIFGVRTE